jgi:two-component system, response regulator YesN
MKRILVTDDERPMIESISLIVKRELVGEFEVCGSAMSGREAIEKAAVLAPDIILMDVRMPGLSGLDAIREIRRRGSTAVFILVTAYERFEIAREAVELGVVDYLLKPVTKDKLAQALRRSAEAIERRGEAERREIEHREREETMRGFVETAFLHGVVLGESFGGELGKYRAVLGLQEPLAVVAAIAFLPPPGSLNPDEDLRLLHEGFRATIRYKTTALAGPLVSGCSVVLLPLKEAPAAVEAVASLRGLIHQAHGHDVEKGFLRLGFGTTRPIEEASLSWSEALREVLGRADQAGRAAREPASPERWVLDDDETFIEGLAGGAPERARLALERILGALREQPEVDLPDRYRVIALYGSAARTLARRGLLDSPGTVSMVECEELRLAQTGAGFVLAARARFSTLVQLIGRQPQWSPLVSRAISYVRDNFGGPMSLETTAYALGISPNRLSRLFSEETGSGFSDYLIEYRIEKAKALLLQPGASIKQVSISCGYPDPNYFSRLFKKITGLTPTTFSSGVPEAGDGTA